MGGLQMLTNAYSLYYGKYGIRVNNIEPGHIETPIHTNRIASFYKSTEKAQKYYKKTAKAFESITPIGRLGQTKDIVDAIIFLSDPNKSGFITGQNIIIDGGLSL